MQNLECKRTMILGKMARTPEIISVTYSLDIDHVFQTLLDNNTKAWKRPITRKIETIHRVMTCRFHVKQDRAYLEIKLDVGKLDEDLWNATWHLVERTIEQHLDIEIYDHALETA